MHFTVGNGQIDIIYKTFEAIAMQVCPHCQVEKHGLVFKTSCDRRNGTVSSPDFVRTRICRNLNHKNCLNATGKIDRNLEYNNQGIKTEDWLDVAREIRKSHI